MTEDFLQELANAASDDEREWLAIRDLLAALPVELASAAYAAAVPHWFDTEILAALRPELHDRSAELYAQLQTLPFVEPFEGRGHNVHELTRKLMLAHLWQNRREEFAALSERAAHYFETLIGEASRQLEAEQEELARAETTDDQDGRLQNWIQQHPEIVRALVPQTRIEQIYHLLVADSEKGADAIWGQGTTWYNSPNFAYTLVSALAQAVREHVDNGRVQGRTRGWGRFWEGEIARIYYQNQEAKTAFAEAIANADADDQLKANCIKSLGDVHVRLSELPEARERYEQALPIYRAIGDKLGEANCIQRLGDIAVEEKDWNAARKLYEDAIAIRRAISPADEAAGYSALGAMYERQKEYAKAIEAYSRALELFPDHVYIWRNRAELYLKMKDATNAEHDIETAAGLQPENAYLFLRRGQLAILQGRYAEALTHLAAALERYPRMNNAHFYMG